MAGRSCAAFPGGSRRLSGRGNGRFEGSASVTDTERIDALEAFIQTQPLLLWRGGYDYPGGPISGLSLVGGGRTLREALDACFAGSGAGCATATSSLMENQ